MGIKPVGECPIFFHLMGGTNVDLSLVDVVVVVVVVAVVFVVVVFVFVVVVVAFIVVVVFAVCVFRWNLRLAAGIRGGLVRCQVSIRGRRGKKIRS